MTIIVSLSSLDPVQVEKLLDESFGPDRHKRTAYLLRRNTKVLAHLSFAMVDEDVLAASIQCWPVSIGSAPLILVGPVAVAPARQKQGLGHQLMNAMFGGLNPHDPPMVMIGDPEYYGRFGFDAKNTGGWTLPGPWEPDRLLLRNPTGIKLPETGMLGPRPGI